MEYHGYGISYIIILTHFRVQLYKIYSIIIYSFFVVLFAVAVWLV